ncbi:MAG: IS200/IS605 family transposase, partial [Bacteroidetes bacterium]|nr:IS200/IS605 family transposase [Bacteroidota bacterium]
MHGRHSLISKFHREELQQFITGIVQKREQKMLSVFSMPDHTHLLIGLNPKIAVSDLVRDIKAGSSKYINDRHWLNRKFSWQAGFGAFSYSKSQIDRVVKYILNQEQHHHKS